MLDRTQQAFSLPDPAARGSRLIFIQGRVCILSAPSTKSTFAIAGDKRPQVPLGRNQRNAVDLKSNGGVDDDQRRGPPGSPSKTEDRETQAACVSAVPTYLESRDGQPIGNLSPLPFPGDCPCASPHGMQSPLQVRFPPRLDRTSGRGDIRNPSPMQLLLSGSPSHNVSDFVLCRRS